MCAKMESNRFLDFPIEELLSRVTSSKARVKTLDFDLFIDSTHTVCEALKHYDVQTTAEAVFSIVKDVYYYSDFGKSKKADKAFANWIICKTFNLRTF
jgi:hypothetical protein